MSPSAPGIEEIRCLEESLAKGHEWLEKALRAGLPERASFWELVLAKNLVCKKIKKKNNKKSSCLFPAVFQEEMTLVPLHK